MEVDSRAVVLVSVLIAILTSFFLLETFIRDKDERKLWCSAVHSEADLYRKCLQVGVKTLEE